MVYCDRDELGLARDTLARARKESRTDRDRQAYHLFRGLLEWLQGREENGRDILNKVADRYDHNQNLPGLTVARIFLANRLLLTRGPEDPEHLEQLARLMELVEGHDLFDVVERYRPFTIPLFLNGVIKAFLRCSPGAC